MESSARAIREVGHYPAAFTPTRLANCTSPKLHTRLSMGRNGSGFSIGTGQKQTDADTCQRHSALAQDHGYRTKMRG